MSEEYTTGLEKIFTVMDRHYEEQAQQIDEEAQAAGIECQALTKQACPVGTPESTHKKGYIGGTLRASYQYWRIGPRECKVSTRVGYGPDVEFGTKKMKARPHFFPAYQTAMRNLQDRLQALGA